MTLLAIVDRGLEQNKLVPRARAARQDTAQIPRNGPVPGAVSS